MSDLALTAEQPLRSPLASEVARRRTFAIISHPDAGKTTLTEKLLLFGGAIAMAGTVKGRKAARHATSDWMRLEQQRGISVTSSVMQFPYGDCVVNLLDTPGHEDFSEDTYRTLTAVDSALMVIDCAKGVEERTIKLMEVCRLRDTPIMTFINKLDRDGRPPIELLDEIELVKGATDTFDPDAYRSGKQTPVFFGSAINNFGIEELLASFTAHAPGPLPRATRERTVEPEEEALAGFVFKIQANMDPGHRDRIAFLRLCAGRYTRGMRLFHVRLDKEVRVADALTFMAADRVQAEEAYAGDIIGLHNHGTINIGDTFTQGERLTFTGVPDFAPEIFRRAVLKDPLRMKALQKGLSQLCEEGATQLFRPLRNNDLVLGAVGQLQFEVVAFRLQDEYGVQCVFEPVAVHTARWVDAADPRKLEEFTVRAHDHLARDHKGALVYLAPSRINLQLTLERWPDIIFRETREHAV